MRKSHVSSVLVLVFGSALLIGMMPLSVRGQIGGTTTGATVTANGPKFKDTATTFDMNYFTSCPYITNGVAAVPDFAKYNFVFAGQGVASGIPNIPASDFTIAQYKPWVVNNNTKVNYVTDPATDNKGNNLITQRGITNEDAGGADILINYTPRKMTNDPTSVNFVQAYIASLNGAAFTDGTIDNGTSMYPYYNGTGVAGSGATLRVKETPPLTASPTSPAWMVDVPFTGPPDTSETDYFQAFISSPVMLTNPATGMPQTYNVLYGGVSWGYSFSEAALPSPEPSSVGLFGGIFGAAVLRRRRTN